MLEQETNMLGKFILIFPLLIAPVLSLAGELEDRAEYARRFSTMFIDEKFAALDRLSDEYRTTESRSASGLWMLTHFYAGITTVADTDIPDENYWANIEAKALRWAEASPNSPAPHNVYASFLIAHGWRFRGSGWAHKVRKEDWAPFYEKLAKAREYLLQNKRIASIDPKWYEEMMVIARAEQWDRRRFDELVNEAISRHPYFYQIYFAALDYLVPKWHGSKEEVEKFAKLSVEATKIREETGMYARVYWYASQTQFGNGLFTESSVVWDKMKKGIDAVLARYPDQWNINNFTRFACLAGDKNKARELIGRIEGAPLARAWSDDPQLFEKCKVWVNDRLG